MTSDKTRIPGEVVRENIVTMIRDNHLSGERAKDFVLLVSVKDSLALEEYLERGFLGEALRKEYFVKGILATLPRFLGFTTIWRVEEETVFMPISELSQQQLIKVVTAQKSIIKELWEHRQRL